MYRDSISPKYGNSLITATTIAAIATYVKNQMNRRKYSLFSLSFHFT
jgi:hypothetical protein